MKKISTLLTLMIAIIGFAQAQSDDKFYFPTKDWDPIAAHISYEEISLKRDSVSLSALWLRPDSRPKGTILFFHGSGGNVSRYLFMTQPLVEEGFQVLIIDFRGYGKSTGKPTHLNIAEDGQFVFDYLLSRDDVEDDQIILFGASIGTQLATKLARDNPERTRALILDGPFRSFTAMALHYAPESQHEMIRQHLAFPYGAEEDIQHLTSIPVLIVHSKEDEEAPLKGAEVVFEKSSGPKDFWVYEGKHLMAMQLAPDIYLQKIEALLEQ